MRRLLVTGASGVLGWNVCALGKDRWLGVGVVHRHPIELPGAGTGLLMALGAGGGILHLGGRERISRYGLGILLAELLGAATCLVRPARQRDRPVGAPRPADVSLDSARAYALGYDPPSLRDDLTHCLRDIGQAW